MNLRGGIDSAKGEEKAEEWLRSIWKMYLFSSLVYIREKTGNFAILQEKKNVIVRKVT